MSTRSARALKQTGNPTGVMLRSHPQHSELRLLKIVGRQREFPVMFKRGVGSPRRILNAGRIFGFGRHRNVVSASGA